jgi:hypothetical protein
MTSKLFSRRLMHVSSPFGSQLRTSRIASAFAKAPPHERRVHLASRRLPGSWDVALPIVSIAAEPSTYQIRQRLSIISTSTRSYRRATRLAEVGRRSSICRTSGTTWLRLTTFDCSCAGACGFLTRGGRFEYRGKMRHCHRMRGSINHRSARPSSTYHPGNHGLRDRSRGIGQQTRVAQVISARKFLVLLFHQRLVTLSDALTDSHPK